MADLSTPFCELKDAADRKGYLSGLLRFAAASQPDVDQGVLSALIVPHVPIPARIGQRLPRAMRRSRSCG